MNGFVEMRGDLKSLMDGLTYPRRRPALCATPTRLAKDKTAGVLKGICLTRWLRVDFVNPTYYYSNPGGQKRSPDYGQLP